MTRQRQPAVACRQGHSADQGLQVRRPITIQASLPARGLLGAQLRQQLMPLVEGAGQGMGEPTAAPQAGGGNIHQIQVRLTFQPGQCFGAQLVERRRTAGAEQQQPGPRNRSNPVIQGLRRRGEHGMGVGAAKAKRTHAENRLLCAGGEGLQFGLHLQAKRRPIHPGIGSVDMQAGRQLPVAQAKHGLDQTGDPRRRFTVAQVGFQRPHAAGPLRAPLGAQHGAQGPQLDRIPLAGACAMGFHIQTGTRIQSCLGIGPADAVGLSPLAGGRHPRAAAIGIHGRAANHRLDRITIAQGGRKRLEQHSPSPLGAHITIRIGIETAATALRREQPGLAEGHLQARMNQGLHPPGQGQLRFAAPEAGAGLIHSHKRRGASRIDRETGAPPVEAVGDPIGGNAPGVARENEGIVIRGKPTLLRGPEQGAVIATGNAHKHTH